MSDGRLTFDTKLDNSGLKEGLKGIGKDAGDAMNIAGTAFEKTGAKLTKYITKPALAAGGALVGLSLVKGFNRLKNIDTAKAQLEGIGHSAKEVEGIMDSAMKSVKGTAYGFDEAATAAASAVSSGIAPGKELTRYLGLVGDAAAQSNLSFTEMGSIFNKIQARGKMSMEEVNQLADQGIPIYKMLADQVGVTSAEIADMVSKGEIDSETFLKAIETNIGGAAKIMGEKSFVGAVANIGASIGRIGANFLDAGGKGGGFFSQLKPLMADFMDTLGVIEDKSAKWGETFGKTFSKVVKFISAMPGDLRAAAVIMPILAGPALKLVGSILKGMVALNKFKAASSGASLAVGVLGGELTASQAILGSFGNKTVATAAKVKGAFASIKSAAVKASNATAGNTTANLKNKASRSVSSLTKYIGSMIKSTAATVSNTAATLVNAAATSKVGTKASAAATKVLAFATAHRVAMLAALGLAAPIIAIAAYMAKTGASAEEVAQKITVFSDKLAAGITAFADGFPAMVESVVTGLTEVINALVGTLPTLIPIVIGAGLQLFMGLVDALTQIIGPLVGVIPTIIGALVEVLPTMIPALINAGILLFMGLVQAITKSIGPIAAAIPQIISAIVDAIAVLVPAIIEAGITLFMALIDAIPQIIPPLLEAIPQIIFAIVSALLSALPQIFSVGVQILKKLWSGISSWVGSLKSKVLSFAQSLPGKIKEGLGSLLSIGGDWIKGLWNGIGEKKDWLCNKIKGLAGDAKNAIKDFFGIKSPSRVMRDEVGRYISEGIGVGIQEQTPKLIARAKAQAGEIKSAYSGTLNSDISEAIGARFVQHHVDNRVTETGVTNVEQTINFYSKVKSPIEISRELKKQAMFGLAGE